MTSLTEPIVFVAECPNGHLVIVQRERDELSSSIETHLLTAYCECCVQQWIPGPELEQRLKDRLRMERYMVALGTS